MMTVADLSKGKELQWQYQHGITLPLIVFYLITEARTCTHYLFLCKWRKNQRLNIHANQFLFNSHVNLQVETIFKIYFIQTILFYLFFFIIQTIKKFSTSKADVYSRVGEILIITYYVWLNNYQAYIIAYITY